MDPMLTGWLACPRDGGELADTEGGAGVTCQVCSTKYAARDGMLDRGDGEFGVYGGE